MSLNDSEAGSRFYVLVNSNKVLLMPQAWIVAVLSWVKHFNGDESPSAVHSHDIQWSHRTYCTLYVCVCVCVYRERCCCLSGSAGGTAALLSCSPPRSSWWEEEERRRINSHTTCDEEESWIVYWAHVSSWTVRCILKDETWFVEEK